MRKFGMMMAAAVLAAAAGPATAQGPPPPAPHRYFAWENPGNPDRPHIVAASGILYRHTDGDEMVMTVQIKGQPNTVYLVSLWLKAGGENTPPNEFDPDSMTEYAGVLIRTDANGDGYGLLDEDHLTPQPTDGWWWALSIGDEFGQENFDGTGANWVAKP